MSLQSSNHFIDVAHTAFLYVDDVPPTSRSITSAFREFY